MRFDPGITLAAGIWATDLLTAIMTTSLVLGWTHLDFGRLLGGMVGPNDRRGALIGLSLHGAIGLAFSIIYGWLFQEFELLPDPRLAASVGAGIGVYHWLLSMPLIGMARALNPHVRTGKMADPGIWGIRFGPQEALIRLLAHLVYGATMGGLSAVLHLGQARLVPGTVWAVATGLVAWAALVAFHTSWLEPILMPRVTFEPGDSHDEETREADRRRLLARYRRGEITWDEYQHARRELASEP